MSRVWLARWASPWLLLAGLAAYPLMGPLDRLLFELTGLWLSEQLTSLFIYGLLALGLNVVVGYTGLLHLGMGAFFGIGAYVTGILTVPEVYPFEWGLVPAIGAAALVAGLVGVLLSAPLLRLRGDYLAIVTLGFGEVVRFGLKNLESITAGSRGLNPIPAPEPPAWIAAALGGLGVEPPRAWAYLVLLGVLAVVVAVLVNLERSRLGRAWIAVREDELAATCMGVNTARAKLSALALGAALAGLGGGLFASVLRTTTDPETFSFNLSITALCCVILGGLGSIRGTLLGVLLVFGFDLVFTPIVDDLLQRLDPNPEGIPWRTFKNWKLLVFGGALVLMMRFRPEGLLPSRRVRLELHPAAPAATEGVGG
jgi:branched-chain amino acid transport system permease protein